MPQISENKILVIACGVLRLDLEAAVEALGIDVEIEYLEGGLHNVPGELRHRLQDSIDAASASGKYSRIVLGYGICGRGTVGLTVSNIPLCIPRVHDCISLFLGSDQAYYKEFADQPGTFYISAGWYEEQVQPKGGKSQIDESSRESITDLNKNELKKKYGPDNAREIIDFVSTWKKNYSRAAFIDTGAGDRQRYESYAQALSREFNWEYKKISGGTGLLQELLTAESSTENILYVPPGHVTRFDPREKKIAAVPLWEDKNGSRIRYMHYDLTSRKDHDKALSGRRYGLGIDAGGTYTDAVIYDFTNQEILESGKALTTKWDFTIGIENSIKDFNPDLLSKIDIVSVSTTLATNAIVENHGQKVGLIVMPGGKYDSKDILHRPIAVVSGSLDIRGSEMEPLDEDAVRRAASKMVKNDGVTVFAVSGYGGAVNPDHELRAKKCIEEETGLHVCCGHELSDLYNFLVRANTAVLNARIIPLLESFLEDVEKSLSAKKIHAPTMVVRGDGTLMNSSAAKDRPIETILSGPAASIAGARFLTDIQDAAVIDIGGTTSDIGTIRNGSVDVCSKGAKVGGWRTHVRALDLTTLGLGGDSEIAFEKQALSVGPRRIAPISWLGSEYDLSEALDYLDENLDQYITSTVPMEFLVRTGTGEHLSFTKEEEKILEALDAGPCSILELAERTGAGYWMILRYKRLEDHFILQRCGLTPTDLLHVEGKMDLWDTGTAEKMLSVFAPRTGLSRNEFLIKAGDVSSRKLVTELIRSQFPGDDDYSEIEECSSCRALMDALFRKNGTLKIKAEMTNPVIGLGAPASHFLTPVSGFLKGEFIIPENGNVANAIGAVTSSVMVKKQVSIVPTSEGGYTIIGLPGHFITGNFEKAQEYAAEELKNILLERAEAAGTKEKKLTIQIEDRIASAADGTDVFLECVLSGEITGLPDTGN